MKCIKKLTDEDLGLQNVPFHDPRVRLGARGIILNQEKQIAIFFKEAKNEYKLIGGGINDDEDPIKAFKREALEETGCIIEVDDFLGITEELKSHDNFKQTSYIYVAHVVKDTKENNLTNEEKAEKSQLVWLDIDTAMQKIKDCEEHLIASKFEEKSIYHTRFIVKRDYAILNYYKKIYDDF